jgi:hypothetical protein
MTFLSLSALVSLAALAAAPLPDHLENIQVVGVPQLEQSADWRVRQQAAAIRAWQESPDLAELAWDLQPRPTRAGHPRFHDPALRDSGMAPVVLERLLSQGEPEEVRMALVDLLPRIGGEWDAALAAAYDSEPQAGVRMMMVETARRASPDVARQLVALGAADDATTARAAAMRAASHVEDTPELAPLLLAGMADTAPEVRAFAARSAGWLELSDTIAPLQTLLRDEDAEVRLSALRAIERIDVSVLKTGATLQTLSQDTDPRVARAAVKLLQP